MFGSKPEINHVRSFGSLTYRHELHNGFSSRLPTGCRRLSRVFLHETQIDFVSDVKINEFVNYYDRYETSYLTKFKIWLHTFNEPIEEGELVAYADGDRDGSSQLAEN